MFYYCAFWVAVFGLVFGSFFNCTAMRIARGEDFIHGKSHCMSCGHNLGARDLIPLFSWLFSGGRCRYCGSRISPRYPATEFLFALLVEALYLRWGLSPRFGMYAVLCGCLFTLSLVDIECMEIPDGCLFIGAIAFCVAAPFTLTGMREFMLHIAAGVAFGGGMLLLSLLMDAVLQKESMGGGDIKLFALLGLYLGFVETLLCIILSCVCGLLFAGMYNSRHKETGGAFPFGPSIASAGYVMLLCGDILRDWYLSLLL